MNSDDPMGKEARPDRNPTQPNEQRSDIDPRRLRALEALLEGATAAEVAVELGVNRSTIWRWTREPTFAAQYRAAASDRLEHAASRLDDAARGAVDVLHDVAQNEEIDPGVRVRAASSLLQHAGFVRRVAEWETERDASFRSALARGERTQDLLALVAADMARIPEGRAAMRAQLRLTQKTDGESE